MEESGAFWFSPPRLSYLLNEALPYACVFNPGEWPAPDCRGCRQHPAALGLARQPGTHGHEVRLGYRAVRRVYRASRWRCGALLRVARFRSRHATDYDDREVEPDILAPRAESMDRRGRPAVRVLPVEPSHGRGGAAATDE